MKININKKILYFTLFIVAGDGIINYAVYESNIRLHNSEQWVQHTEQVIYQSDKVLLLTKDVEVALRDLIIINDTSLLNSLHASEKKISLGISQLKQLTQDNAMQQRRTDSLDLYMRKRLDILFKIVELRKKEGLTSTVDNISFKQGVYYTDRIAQVINAVQQEEETLLKKRKNTNERFIKIFNWFSLVRLILMELFALLLVIATGKYLLQNKQKEKRAAELLIANEELAFQNEQKGKRASELVTANKELAFQNEQKEKRASELVTANEELAFQNEQKGKRASELVTANHELAFQNKEKEKRASELLIANHELAFQNEEKEKRASELLIANHELAFQNEEKEKRASELVTANHELAFQHEQKEKARQERVQSETKLARAQQIAHIGSWEYNFANDIVLLSDESYSIYGLSIHPSGLLFEKWLSYIHPDDFNLVSHKLKECRQSLEDCSYYYRIVRQDGIVRHIYTESKTEYDNNGTPIGLYGIKQDVTEIKNANENLKKSESNLKEAEAIAHLGNWEFDLTNGNYIWSNEMYKIFGMDNNKIIPTLDMYFSFIHPEDLPLIVENINKGFSVAKNDSNDFRFMRKDGIVRYGFSEWKFEFDKNNTAVRVFGITQDVTERKLSEMERSKLVNDLLLHNKDLEQFAYIVSHNLRAPVANILGASVGLKDPNLSAVNRELLNQGINESVLKLDNVVKDLNYILQIKSEVNETKEKVVFSTLVEDIKISIKNLIDKNQITVKYDFSEIDEMLTVKSYLYSIFFNLISNSIKYRRQHIQTIIEIKSLLVNNKIVLLFIDNGMGIDLQKRSGQVFGLYKRFHTNVEGKGMGLFMVKAQVETLGGKIGIISEVNKGAEFKIEFEN